MIESLCRVEGVEQVASGIYVLTFHAPEIAARVLPGQFLNIRVEESCDPLLRRPFSVYWISDGSLEIIFNIVGKGTRSLSQKRTGDTLSVLGPLGTPFHTDVPDHDTAVLLGGGLGVAPLPLTRRALEKAGKNVLLFLGSRTSEQQVHRHLPGVQCATDDGSKGFHGTVVQCLEEYLQHHPIERPKVFACGPTAMLRAVSELASRWAIPCEVSLEGPMACGFGICQGCPVELVGTERKYALMCKDGPTFDVRTIRI